MSVTYKLEEKIRKRINWEKERNFLIESGNILVIEDDYVSYLYLNEMLTALKFNVFRAISLEEAFLESHNFKPINLLIVNFSLSIRSNTSVIKYLKEVYSVPIVIVVDCERKCFNSQELMDWADGVLSLNSDTECFAEAISDVLGK